MANLRTLDLRIVSGPTTSDPLKNLRHLKKLLIGPSLFGVDLLHTFKSLESLEIHMNHSHFYTVCKLQQLKYLFIYGTRLTMKKGFEHLAQLANLETLEVIGLASYLVSGIILSVSDLPKLKVLRLYDPLYIADVALCKEFQKMTSLEELQISANIMDDDALLYISSPQKLRSLKILESKGFSHVGISYLAQLKNMQHLKLSQG
jgi:hypothetical protein